MGDKVGERVGERGEVKVRGAFESNSVWGGYRFVWLALQSSRLGWLWLARLCWRYLRILFFFSLSFRREGGSGGKQTFSSRHRHSQSRVLLFNHTQNPRASPPNQSRY